MPWKACVATLLLALVVGGCGEATSRGEDGGSLEMAASLVWGEPSCPDQLPDSPGSASTTSGDGIPDDFVTSWVLRCRRDVRDVPGDGRWLVHVAERADTSAPDLVDQLRRASEPRSTPTPCPDMLVIPPYFALVDPTGRALLPAMPTDKCGFPRKEARAALEALPFRVLSETRVKQLESQGSIDSGCPEHWKDELVINAGGAGPGPATPVWPTPANTLRVCVYETGRDAGESSGQFASGRTVTGDEARTLSVALDKAGPATACSIPHTRFAVVTREDAGQWAVAELDGCRHLLRPNNTLGQLDAFAIGALIG
jgi:hypothetical protein